MKSDEETRNVNGAMKRQRKRVKKRAVGKRTEENVESKTTIAENQNVGTKSGEKTAKSRIADDQKTTVEVRSGVLKVAAKEKDPLREVAAMMIGEEMRNVNEDEKRGVAGRLARLSRWTMIQEALKPRAMCTRRKVTSTRRRKEMRR
jgi:hypothetical protein